MGDSWRAGIKSNQLVSEEFLFIEIQISRKILISRQNAEQYLKHLGAPEFTELRNAILSFRNSDDPPGRLVGAQFPWTPLLMQNESLHAFADLATEADTQVSWRADGSVDSGATTVYVTIAGREYAYVTRSSAQTRALGDQFTAFSKNLASIQNPTAQVSQTIDILAKIIDWAIRLAAIWDLYERAKEALEAKEAQDREVREFQDKLDKTEGERMDFDNEREFDRISRTA